MVFRKNPPDHEALRRLALARLSVLGGKPAKTVLDQQQVRQLLEELEIRQIELELQNEHLNTARSQLEQALNQSNELYDFSPVGNILLCPDGTIDKLNLTGAKMLGAERARLLGRRFGLFVGEAQRANFNAMLERAKAENEVQTGNLVLHVDDLEPLPVYATVVWSGPFKGWQVSLVDISEQQRLMEKLRDSEERLKLALSAVGDGVWDWQVNSGEVLVSESFAKLLGKSRESFGTQLSELMDLVHPDDKPHVIQLLQDCINGKRDRYHIEHRMQFKDGSIKWMLARGAVVQRSAQGKALRVVGTLVDVSHNKKAQADLAAAAQFQQAVFDATSAQIAVLDPFGMILQVNAAWQRYVSERGFADSIGRSYLTVMAELFVVEMDTVDCVAKGLAALAAGEIPDYFVLEPVQCQCRKCWFTLKFTPVHDAAQRMVATHEDVSVLKQAELASLALANVDTLTGAMSRQHFMSLADQELARARRYQLPLVVLMLDLDHFKDVNDSYGHPTGDQVLKSLVQTVKGVLRETDVVGRIGGEEFAVLLPNTTQEGGCALADRIIEAVRAHPVSFEGHQVDYTVSIGACNLTQQGTFGELLAECDTALYRAKRGGRDRLEMSWDNTGPRPDDSPLQVCG